jgi:hypothetical protein
MKLPGFRIDIPLGTAWRLAQRVIAYFQPREDDP